MLFLLLVNLFFLILFGKLGGEFCQGAGMDGGDLTFLRAVHLEPFTAVTAGDGFGWIIEQHAPEALADYGSGQKAAYLGARKIRAFNIARGNFL
jgi:hypothetical protein